MHGMEHVKFTNAEQAKPVYKYEYKRKIIKNHCVHLVQQNV
jgi:hypothetical protein